MIEELKPCPFCNNQPKITSNDENEFFVRCPFCNAVGDTSHDLELASGYWNIQVRKLDKDIHPCSFCGESALLTWTKWYWDVHCSKCFNSTSGYPALDEAILEWNNQKRRKNLD